MVNGQRPAILSKDTTHPSRNRMKQLSMCSNSAFLYKDSDDGEQANKCIDKETDQEYIPVFLGIRMILQHRPAAAGISDVCQSNHCRNKN